MDDAKLVGRGQNGLGRRGVVAGLTGALLPVAVSASPATPDDERIMREAIALAAQGDFPFGTVIIRNGGEVARGFNMGKQLHDPTAHGEMVAIRRALAEHGPDSLKGATLYTSGEPCIMCMGAIIWCGIGRVVYAASVEQMGQVIGQIMIPTTEIAARTPFTKVDITGGVLADEAMKLFQRPAKPQ